MSKIIYNDRAYGEIIGGGGAGGLGGGIELTQAEYNALDQSEKDKDIIYFITDGNPEGMVVNDSVPIGSIQAYAGTNPPGNWLICTGQAVSRTKYQKLFDVIGTTYGEGDGSTTFNLPDLRGKVAIGQSTTYELGASGGEATHTLSINEIPSHTHNVTAGFTMRGTDYNDSAMLWGGTGTTVAKTTGTGNQVDTVHQVNGAQQTWALTLNRDTTSKGGDAAHNNMQPYLVTNYIIKALDSSIIETEKPNFLDLFYPTGSCYETQDSTFNPNTAWGGTWSLASSTNIYVVEENTSDIWTYRKWSDGMAECWGNYNKTLSGSSQTNEVFITFPFAFIEQPSCTVSLLAGGANYYHVHRVSQSALTEIRLFFANTYSGQTTLTAEMYIKGKWTNDTTTYYRWLRTA